MSHGFNDTTLGLLRAAHNLEAQRQRRLGPKAKPKYSYADGGKAVHATRCLTKAEREELTTILIDTHTAQDMGDQVRMRGLLMELSALPTKFVAVKRATQIDYSKY